MAVVALAFAAGAGWGMWFRTGSPLFWGALTGAFLLGWVLFARRGRRGTIWAAAFFALLGVFRVATEASLPVYDGRRPPEGDAVVSGRLLGNAERAGERTNLILEEALVRAGGETFRCDGTVRVVVYDGRESYFPGAALTARGKLRAPRRNRNTSWPGVLPHRRAAAVLHVSSPRWVREAPAAARGSNLLSPVHLRERALRFWESREGAAPGLLKALTTGDRNGIDAEMRSEFYRSGLGHLIAVSGLHLGALAAMVFFLLRRVLARIEPLAARRPVQPLAALATVPALAFFCLFTGGQVSALRAAVMSAVFLAGIALRRRTAPAALIAAAALAMLFADPSLLATPSFQLSFGAVTVLALAGPSLLHRLRGGRGESVPRRAARYAAGLLAVSTLILVFTAPLTAYHFQSLALLGPLANLLAVPLTVFVVLPLAWGTVAAVLFLPPLRPLFEVPAAFAGEALAGIAGFFASLPLAAVTFPRPSPALSIAVLTAGILLFLPGGKRRRAALAAALAVTILAGGTWALQGPLRRGMGVTFFDVGQGEATLFRLPGGATMLVDTGPQWSSGDAGRYVVTPALRRLGVVSLDYLVVTHFHPDHSGGLAAILEEFAVGEIWLPRGAAGVAGAGLPAALGGGAGGPPVRFWQRGDVTTAGDKVRVSFFNPPAELYGGGRDRDVNDNSLVFTVAGPAMEVLMTGDIGAGPLAEIAPLLGPPRARRIVKVPHHGARQGGTALLARRYRPEYAVISVGRNRYGHPHPSTIASYGATAKVLRTDREGAVFFDGGAQGLHGRTWRGDADGGGGVWRSIRWAFGAL